MLSDTRRVKAGGIGFLLGRTSQEVKHEKETRKDWEDSQRVYEGMY